ncbi:MAG: MmcQ/YjbR family DNA-binding protein [Chitinophagaceae bacterium]|jgi:predicted DNA-binding protein (MmcQ/YjbR family)|nr:MmcQ/YjbR family DNA-binding protein [Chitinophagaceae bacterium]
MHIESLREFLLTFPGVEEVTPFGPDTLVYKVKGKIFCLMGLDNDPLRFNVKCDPDQAIELREAYPMAVLPGYHMNKKHWNTIVVDGTLSARQLQEYIRESYRLVGGAKV